MWLPFLALWGLQKQDRSWIWPIGKQRSKIISDGGKWPKEDKMRKSVERRKWRGGGGALSARGVREGLPKAWREAEPWMMRRMLWSPGVCKALSTASIPHILSAPWVPWVPSYRNCFCGLLLTGSTTLGESFHCSWELNWKPSLWPWQLHSSKWFLAFVSSWLPTIALKSGAEWALLHFQ